VTDCAPGCAGRPKGTEGFTAAPASASSSAEASWSEAFGWTASALAELEIVASAYNQWKPRRKLEGSSFPDNGVQANTVTELQVQVDSKESTPSA
jgi:hypothetical protein